MKRRKVELRNDDADDSTEIKDKLPAYGNRSYWESRYDSLYSNNCQPVNEKIDPENDKEEIDEDLLVEPKHSWYFSYDELKPLLLPLIIDTTISDHDISDETKSNNCKQQQQTCKDEASERNEGKEMKNSYMDQSHDERTISSKTHVMEKKIIEIGCGDVPLGVKLCQDINTYWTNDVHPSCHSNLPMYQVICSDYSDTLIKHLKENYTSREQQNYDEKWNKKRNPLVAYAQVEFQVHSASELPYHDQIFSLIIDKGTIDAQISKEEHGRKECIRIVHEAARLLMYHGMNVPFLRDKILVPVVLISPTHVSLSHAMIHVKGSFFLVSHFNPSVPSGMILLNEVILPGLQMLKDDTVSWVIEIHGNFNESVDIGEASDDEDDGEVEQESDDEQEDDYDDEDEGYEVGEDFEDEEVIPKQTQEEELSDILGEKTTHSKPESAVNRNEQGEFENHDEDSSHSQNLGPAVYIIKKQEALLGQEKAVTIEFHAH